MKIKTKKSKQESAMKVKKTDSLNLESKASFPRATLEQALKVALVLKDKNGGNQWSPDLVAEALDMTKTTNKFFYLAAASRDFGLTKGTRDTEKIELTDFGRDLVYARSPEIEAQKKREAFMKVDIFRRVLEHYKGSNLPEMRYLANTLKADFGLPEKQHELFSELFRENCSFLGIKSGFVPDEAGSVSDTLIQQQASEGPSVVTLAEAPGKDAPMAFIIMPFSEREASHRPGFFNEVLTKLITPAAREAGFAVKTANRKGSDLIHATIINDLLNADLVVADLTEHNPNVLFELGIRIAKEKPIVLVKTKETGRIFDVDNMIRVEEYSSNLWPSTVERDRIALRDHFRATWDNRAKDRPYMKVLMQAAGNI